MSVNISEKIAPHFYDITCDVMNHKYTHYWYSGGRGSTKSSKIAIDIIMLIATNPDVNALALRKVGKTLRESVYNQMLWAIDKLQITHLFKAALSPLEITYIPTGQKIYFRGADDPVKMKSIKPKQGYMGIVWFEETSEFNETEEIRNILQSANRGGSKFWNFYSYNPPKSRDNWVNLERLEESKDKIHHHSTYKTVPREWLGDQFVLEAEKLKERKPQAYEHEYLGEATGTGGNVFENIVDRAITDEEYKRFDRLKFGIDFGFSNDPFVWIKSHYDRKRQILYILDEIYEIRLSDKAAVEKIKRKHSGSMSITADSENPKSIALMNSYGLNITGAIKGADSVRYGIKFLQDLTEIVIDRNRTPNAYKEFIAYEYERNKSGEFISAYPDKNNHVIDAVRYSLESEMRQSRIYTSNLKLI